MHYGFYLFTHVIVLVTQFERSSAFTKLCIDLIHQMFYLFFTILKFITVMVTNNVGYSALFHISLDTD